MFGFELQCCLNKRLDCLFKKKKEKKSAVFLDGYCFYFVDRSSLLPDWLDTFYP